MQTHRIVFCRQVVPTIRVIMDRVIVVESGADVILHTADISEDEREKYRGGHRNVVHVNRSVTNHILCIGIYHLAFNARKDLDKVPTAVCTEMYNKDIGLMLFRKNAF